MNKQLTQFKKQIENGRLGQSFLMIGPEKTGKFATVVKMAGILNDLSEADLKLVQGGEFPDILLVEMNNRFEFNRDYEINNKNDNFKQKIKTKKNNKKKEKKRSRRELTKKELDKIIEKINLKNFQLKKKVLIIRDADKMTNTATNSLLKLIEEPNDNLVIFLLVNNEEDILTTIKSRCQKIRFFLWKDKEIKKMISKKYDLSNDNIDLVVSLAQGRMEMAKLYGENPDLAQKALKIKNEFREVLRSGKIERLQLVEEIIKNRDSLLWTLNEWIWYLKEFLEENIQTKEKTVILKKIYDILEELLRVRETIKKSNANSRIQLENFFVQI